MFNHLLTVALGASTLFSHAFAVPVKGAADSPLITSDHRNLKRAVTGPVVTSDFPDPSIIRVGNTWYAFGSQSIYNYTNIHIQVATSTDFSTWSLSEGTDALPNLPGWALDDGNCWAPDVNQLADGTFLMYFSATDSADPGHHCIGTATSASITGPYTPTSSEAWVCPTSQGGAIDPSGFLDTDNSRYVLYKIDGNSLGHGGTCGNTVDPIVSTPIMIQQVSASDGITMIGEPSQILTNSAADGPDIEAPSMMKNGDTYIVFFSSNCYATPQYDVSYAYSTSPMSGYTKSSAPLFVTGDEGLTGPGSARIDTDGVHMLLHGQTGGGIRALYTATVSVNGDTVSG